VNKQDEIFSDLKSENTKKISNKVQIKRSSLNIESDSNKRISKSANQLNNNESSFYSKN